MLAAGLDRPPALGTKKVARNIFQFTQAPGENLVVYVRHTSNFLLVRPLVLRTLERDGFLEWWRQISIGIVAGFMVGLILNNFALAFQLRQKMYSKYALFLLSTLVTAMLVNGTIVDLLGFIHFKFDVWLRITLISCFVIVIGYLNFINSFLNTNRNFPRLHRFWKILLPTSVVTLPANYFISPTISFSILGLEVLIIAIHTVLICLPRMHISEVSTSFVAVSGILIGAITQLLYAPATISTIFGLDGLFLLGSAWGGIFLSAAMAKQVEKSTMKSKILREAASKNIPITEVNAYLNDTFAGQFAPSQIEVTIMFVDTASFSKIAESIDARTIFKELSNRLEDMTKIIIDHGGTIDRSLGDGVLCFFGYQTGVFNSKNHVAQAFEAALKIQESYINKMYEAIDKKTPCIPLPIRIGIHTDHVTIGNMGSSFHVDFTMVGNGVNFANRLETACAPNSIMVSEATYQVLLTQKYTANKFDRIMIAVKHQNELVPAYEVNPHSDRMDKVATVNRHFMEMMGDLLRDERHTLNEETTLQATSVYGELAVRDFSRRGFLLRGSSFIAQKSILNINIITKSPAINRQLSERYLTNIEVEVRWSRRNEEFFDHGVQLVGGHPDQWDFLFKLLRSLNSGEEDLVA